MNRITTAKVALVILLAGALGATALACSTAQTAPQAPAAPAPVSQAVPSAPAGNPAAPAAEPATDEKAILAKGEEIFQKAAGGIGCQYCHGKDGKGLIGPNIRGASAGKIQGALQMVEAMEIVRLDKDEIEAVAAYLKYLESQP